MARTYVEARYETGTPGTEAAVAGGFSAKSIFFPGTSFQLIPNPSPLNRNDEMRAANEPLRTFTEYYEPGWSLSQRMYPDSLAFWLKAHLGPPVTTAGNGVITDLDAVAIPAGATRHDWDAPYAIGTTPQTSMFRVADPDDSMFFDVRGATVEKISISMPNSGGAQLDISGRANYASSIADPALSATYESLAIAPFLYAHGGLSWLAGAAQCETISFDIEKAIDHIRTFGGGSKWPNLIEHGEGVVLLGGKFDGRRITTADWAGMIADTRFTALVKWIHSAFITGAYPYKAYVQAPNTSAQLISGGPAAFQNTKRTPASWDFTFTRDAAQSAKIQVVNATASYA